MTDNQYVVRGIADDGHEEERRYSSPGAAFDDYANAMLGGWHQVTVRDEKGRLNAVDLARRARHRA